VCSFRLTEDQTRRRVLDHLQRFYSTAGRPVRRALQEWEMSMACTRSWGACWVRYGLIFLSTFDGARDRD